MLHVRYLDVTVTHDVLLVAGVGGTTTAGVLDAVSTREVVESLCGTCDVTAVCAQQWGVLGREVITSALDLQLTGTPDPPENCHWTVKKSPKT